MKIEIEITEETAALLFANNWGAKGGKTVAQIVQGLAEDGANEYRRNFPRAVERAVTDFRSANIAIGEPHENP